MAVGTRDVDSRREHKSPHPRYGRGLEEVCPMVQAATQNESELTTSP